MTVFQNNARPSNLGVCKGVDGWTYGMAWLTRVWVWLSRLSLFSSLPTCKRGVCTNDHEFQFSTGELPVIYGYTDKCIRIFRLIHPVGRPFRCRPAKPRALSFDSTVYSTKWHAVGIVIQIVIQIHSCQAPTRQTQQGLSGTHTCIHPYPMQWKRLRHREGATAGLPPAKPSTPLDWNLGCVGGSLAPRLDCFVVDYVHFIYPLSLESIHLIHLIEKA